MLFLINFLAAYCSQIDLTSTITSQGIQLYFSLLPSESAASMDAIITYQNYFSCIQAQVQVLYVYQFQIVNQFGTSDSLQQSIYNKAYPWLFTQTILRTPFIIFLLIVLQRFMIIQIIIYQTLSVRVSIAPILTGCGNATLIPTSAIAFDQTILTLSFVPCINFDTNSYVQITFPIMNNLQASNPIDFFSSPTCLPLTCTYINNVLKIQNLSAIN
ncbi:hypothetical protein pb186bvf_002965 [Paramecium bursaria]